MTTSPEVVITPGMQRYIDQNNAYLARRTRYIRDVVKKQRFDTIAVHGLYTVEELHSEGVVDRNSQETLLHAIQVPFHTPSSNTAAAFYP